MNSRLESYPMTQNSGHQSQTEQEPLDREDTALQDDASQCSSDPDAGQSDDKPDDSADNTKDVQDNPGFEDQSLSDESSKNKKGLGKRIAIIIGCVLLACLVGGAAYFLWFTNALDKALAPSDSTESATKDVLAPERSGEPYYVLILGSDSREGNYSGSVDQQGNNERSDVMMLIRIDEKNKKITMLSIPRDTPYKLEDGSFVKINEMFNVEGVAGAIRAVHDTTNVPISHHAEIRISGLENVVDLLGGVEVDVPTDLSYMTTDNHKVTIKAGKQKLNGKEAQIFVRARHEFGDNQDQHRQDNVRQLLQAIIDEVTSRPITEIPGLVLQIAEYIDTDLKTMDAIGLATVFAGDKTTMYSGTGPTEGAVNELAGNKWLCYQNPEGWKKIIEVVDSGKNPKRAEINYEETQIPWTDVTDQPEFRSSLAHRYYYGWSPTDEDKTKQGDDQGQASGQNTGEAQKDGSSASQEAA